MKIKDLIKHLSEFDPETEIRQLNGSVLEKTTVNVLLCGVSDKDKITNLKNDGTDVAVLVGA